MFDEETAAKLRGKNADAILALQEGLELRATAKSLADEAKATLQEANDMLMPAMIALEIDKAVAPGIGSLLFTPSKKTTSFKKKLLSEYLLSHGVSADLLKAAMDHATAESESPEMRFTAAKTS